jgi:hypothetical protein
VHEVPWPHPATDPNRVGAPVSAVEPASDVGLAPADPPEPPVDPTPHELGGVADPPAPPAPVGPGPLSGTAAACPADPPFPDGCWTVSDGEPLFVSGLTPQAVLPTAAITANHLPEPPSLICRVMTRLRSAGDHPR